ncbi:MAG: acyltransferase [Pseudomonadales bacterium]|jgi:acetyltransferase-like isoleucine patch superfamily enzyme
MRADLRPYPVKRLHRALERAYVNHFIAPQLDALGTHFQIMKPWYLKLHGANIRIGASPHIITARDRRVALTTWRFEDAEGHIDIGDYCLLCPGVRLDSACGIHVGNNTMFASSAYVTDADWHDIYDRARPIGNRAPVVLEDNVWVGDSAIVCKGVTIGENSVVGAGAVVASDIPANVIAVGNPARVIKTLDPERLMRKREDLLSDGPALDRQIDALDRFLLASNGWLRWLRSLVNPRRGD